MDPTDQGPLQVTDADLALVPVPVPSPVPAPVPAADSAAGEFGADADRQGPAPNRLLVWIVLLACLVLVLAFPVGHAAAWALTPPKRFPDGPWLEAVPTLAAAALIATWVFVFWSLIGSFLNVVVHRLPRGESVVSGGSRCPRCTSPITWHDNLPIVGWLRLGGRCRSCGLPIAARYPIVESITAALCTAIYFRELLSGGANLPVRAPDLLHGGLLRAIPDPRIDLVGLCVFHSGLICVLLAWGLIAQDGRRVPRRSILSMLAVAAVLTMLFPALHPLGWATVPAEGMNGGDHGGRAWLGQGLAVSVVGCLAGYACGLGLQSLLGRMLEGNASGRTGMPLRRPLSLAPCLAIVGAVYGWQGMLATTTLLLTACLGQILVWSSVTDWPAASVELLLVPATFVHLCLWRQLIAAFGPWWPSSPTPACLLVPSAMVILIAVALTAIAPSAVRTDDATA